MKGVPSGSRRALTRDARCLPCFHYPVSRERHEGLLLAGQNRTFRDIRPDYIFSECPNLSHSVPSHGANETPAPRGRREGILLRKQTLKGHTNSPSPMKGVPSGSRRALTRDAGCLPCFHYPVSRERHEGLFLTRTKADISPSRSESRPFAQPTQYFEGLEVQGRKRAFFREGEGGQTRYPTRLRAGRSLNHGSRLSR